MAQKFWNAIGMVERITLPYSILVKAWWKDSPPPFPGVRQDLKTPALPDEFGWKLVVGNVQLDGQGC